MPIEVGDWTALPDGWGDDLAVSGSRSAAASPAGITVWEGDRPVASAVPTGFSVGTPRFVGSRLYYGTGWLERTYTAITLPVTAQPRGSISAVAWRADGSAALIVRAGPQSALSILADGEETAVGTVDERIAAAWLGARPVAIGARLWAFDPEVQREAHPGGVAAVSDSADGRWLLTVGLEGSALLWDTKTWTPSPALRGDWVGGALAPDGAWAVLVDRGGALHVACGPKLERLGSVASPGDVAAIAVGQDRVLASFRDAPRVRTAPLSVKCR